jgi:hypothetical protein
MKLILEFGPQFIALILALIQIKTLNRGYIFIALQVALSISTDLIAINYTGFQQSNELIYNFYLLLETILLSAAIYYSINNKSFKKIIKALIGLYFVVAIITFSLSSIHKLNNTTLIFGFFILAIFNLYFIIHPDTKKSLTKNPMMVIAIGQVVYFLGVTPYYVGRHVLIAEYPLLADKLFNYINNSLAIIRYISILIGFSILLYLNNRKIKA